MIGVIVFLISIAAGLWSLTLPNENIAVTTGSADASETLS
jgi:hypothetical protein